MIRANQAGGASNLRRSRKGRIIVTTKERTGAVLVVGGGIAGIQAALDLADTGFLVHLVERGPAIGGTMSRLDKTYPTNDCAM
jgi:heterodisulfide reductase subunit A2